MKSSEKKAKGLTRSELAWRVFIITLPFLMFYWMIPFFSRLTIGNDYTIFPVRQQMELMFSLKTGSFPLYAPGFAGGHSASALMVGQFCHPISFVASHMPAYWAGKALEWNTLFRLITLAVAQLSFYVFLKRLSMRSVIAFLLSMIAVYNLRMLDLFRYGASLESWTGYIFLCTAIGFNWIYRKKLKYVLFIIASTYWLITSGHPQMTYYGLLGAGLFALIVPYFAGCILPEKGVETEKVLLFWGKIILFCGIGVLMAFPFILPLKFEFIATNMGRVGQDYAWANSYSDTFSGTLNNFFLPLRSSVQGVFGGSPLFLAAVFVPVLRLFRLKVPRFVWAIWFIVLIAFMHMQGDRTLIHYLVWKILPMASSFRVAGRISLIMPLLMVMILVWAVHVFKTNKAPLTILLSGALLAMGVYSFAALFSFSDPTDFSAFAIRNIPKWVESAAFFSGALVLVFLIINTSWSKMKFTTGFFLIILSCFQLGLFLKYGTWVEQKKNTWSFGKLAETKESKLDYAFSPGAGMYSSSVSRQMQDSCLEPFLGKVYTKYRVAKDNESAYAMIKEGRVPDEVILEEFDLSKEGMEPVATKAGSVNRAELVYSSYNKLSFTVESSEAGFLGLGYPYVKNWQAIVDGNEAQVFRANGNAMAVSVPQGKSSVEFRYWSTASLWGMLVSCATFAGLLCIVGLRSFKIRRNAVLFNVIILIAFAALFAGWFKSLYSGDNLNMQYLWHSGMQEDLSNLAYGKTTGKSSLLYPPFPHVVGSGKAVDGDKTPGSGFVSGNDLNPVWIVDLSDAVEIDSINIYEYGCDVNLNVRPLLVETSIDGKDFFVIQKVPVTQKTEYPIRVILEKPTRARYVMIRASGKCCLALDEVEVYGENSNL